MQQDIRKDVCALARANGLGKATFFFFLTFFFKASEQ